MKELGTVMMAVVVQPELVVNCVRLVCVTQGEIWRFLQVVAYRLCAQWPLESMLCR